MHVTPKFTRGQYKHKPHTHSPHQVHACQAQDWVAHQWTAVGCACCHSVPPGEGAGVRWVGVQCPPLVTTCPLAILPGSALSLHLRNTTTTHCEGLHRTEHYTPQPPYTVHNCTVHNAITISIKLTHLFILHHTDKSLHHPYSIKLVHLVTLHQTDKFSSPSIKLIHLFTLQTPPSN